MTSATGSSTQAGRINRAPCRSAFTLLETLLVLRAGGHGRHCLADVRSRLRWHSLAERRRAGAGRFDAHRVTAISTGQPQAFRCEPNSGQYSVSALPDDGSGTDSSGGSTASTGASASPGAGSSSSGSSGGASTGCYQRTARWHGVFDRPTHCGYAIVIRRRTVGGIRRIKRSASTIVLYRWHFVRWQRDPLE